MDRRRLILSAAASLFASNGYAGTTVRRIADRVGILSGSIYHHFSSKDEIFDAIVRQYVCDRHNAVLSAARAGGRFLDTVASMATVQLAHVVSNLVVSGIVLDEARMLRGNEKFAFVRAAEAELLNEWCAVISGAVHAGTLHPEIDCNLIASSIMTLIDNSARLARSSDGAAGSQSDGSEERIIEDLSAIVFAMISPWSR